MWWIVIYTLHNGFGKEDTQHYRVFNNSEIDKAEQFFDNLQEKANLLSAEWGKLEHYGCHNCE